MRPVNITLAALTLLASVPVLAGEEKPIELDAVPEEIMDIAHGIIDRMNTAHTRDTGLTFDDYDADDHAPDADDERITVNFVSANTETESDGPDDYVYEIKGLLADGRRVEFDIFPSGKVQEVEVEFSAAMVPGAVMKAIEREYPGFTPSFIEATHSRSLKVIGYEIVGTVGDKTLDLEVSADGHQIRVGDQ